MKRKCPPLEEAIEEYIKNEADKERALAFATWLRKNKISPIAIKSGYNWHVRFYYSDIRDGKSHRGSYNGVYIKLFDNTWHIFPSKDIAKQVLLRNDIKEIILDSISPCHGCAYDCFTHTRYSEGNITIFDCDIPTKGVCLQQPMRFTNPNDKTLDAIKEILLKRKNGEDLIIGEGKSIYYYGMI